MVAVPILGSHVTTIGSRSWGAFKADCFGSEPVTGRHTQANILNTLRENVRQVMRLR